MDWKKVKSGAEKITTLASSAKTLGRRRKVETEMDEEQKKKCHQIIHTASTLAGGVGAGLAQLPLSDNAVIIPIQTTMTVALGQVFGMKLTKSAATATAATALASTVGRGTSQILVGWIPGYGNVINASTAAAITEAVGWHIANEFYADWRDQNPNAPERAVILEEMEREDSDVEAEIAEEEKLETVEVEEMPED